MPELTAENVIEIQKAILELMEQHPEKVEKAKGLSHEERKKLLEESEEMQEKMKAARVKYGFEGAPEGSMRAAMKMHMMNPEVVAVQKKIFEKLPPADDSPEEMKMYHKMVMG
eukprot:TRINITY_DN35397_c0_g1_i1.p2 TRINITY_DN35397_c0_g1~~TRINITY_DN35397_c0_g1_i1.p2  ORF type:complete len:113 (+),score=58.30 TRINITY_DN35397_c0_g1_i1:64-402(+)